VPVTEPPYASVGWLAEASVEQQRRAWTEAVEELARIHVVPGEQVSFIGWPRHGRTGEDQQLGYWSHYREWSGVPVSDEMAELAEWVTSERPHEPGIALSWGDARPGNMIFGADFGLQGVLDWDQMSLAAPRHDLAWWLLFDELNTTYKGVPRLPGFGSRDDTITLWEARTGLVAGDLSWHQAFTTYKLALITLHMLRLAGTPDRAEASAAFILGFGRRAAGLDPG
jgi:aminoglycoside phosphotransferase (APT) family kinase protein